MPEPLVFLQGFLSLVLCTTLVCLASWRSAIFLLGDVEIPELGLGAGVVASGHVCVVSTTLGICGQLNLPCIVTAFALTSLLILHFLPALPRYCFKGEEELKIFAARWRVLVCTISTWIGFWIARAISLPPLTWDSVVYHLPISLRWYQQGGFNGIEQFSGVNETCYFPMNREVLDTLVMAFFGNDSCVGLVNYPFLIVGTLGVQVLSRKLGATLRSSWIAALAFVLTPMVYSSQLNTSYTDLYFCSVLIGGLALSLPPPEGGNEASGLSRAVLFGFGSGLALGTKYLALLLVPILIPVPFLATGSRPDLRSQMSRLCAILCCWLLLAGYWYGRNLLTTGNPIYPARIPILGDVVPHEALSGSQRTILLSTLHEPGVLERLGNGYIGEFGVFGVLNLVAVGPLTLFAFLLAGRRLHRDSRFFTMFISILPLFFLCVHVVTPNTGVHGVEAANLRYLLPGYAITLAVVASHITRYSRRGRLFEWAIPVSLAHSISVNSLMRHHFPDPAFAPIVALLFGLAGFHAFGLVRCSRRLRHLGFFVLLTVSGLLLRFGAGLSLDPILRYEKYLGYYHNGIIGPAARWISENLHGERIAHLGIRMTYFLGGQDLSNSLHPVNEDGTVDWLHRETIAGSNCAKDQRTERFAAELDRLDISIVVAIDPPDAVTATLALGTVPFFLANEPKRFLELTRLGGVRIYRVLKQVTTPT